MSLDPAQMMEIAEEVPATAGRDVTYLLVDHLLQFDAQGRLTERVHYVYRVDRTREHGPRGITAPPWHPWFEGRPTGGARVIRPDGSVTALDLATLVETTPEPGYLMYQDTHELEGPLPGVTQGAIVEEVWTIAEHRPFSLAGSGAAFGLDSDAELLRVRVEAPASRPLRWAVTGRDAPEVVKRRDGDLVVLELTASHLPPLPRWAGDLPLETALERRLEISAAASWSAVADAWRGEAEAMIDPRGWEDVVASVRAAPDRNAAITIATRAVQADIQYVGLELGSRSIVPWKPSEVRARGFGDCKDQATTVVAILRAAGIAADIALLRRGYDTEPAELLPNAGHFNHAIVYVPQQAGKPAVWVDVTNPEVAIGDLPADDQDRWALVTAPGTRNVVRTPVFPASHRVLIERDLTTPGVISGKTTSTTSGWLGSEAREPAARNATVFTPAQASERTSGLRYGRLLDWSGEVDPRAPDPLTTWATWTWDGVPALGSTVPISFDEDLAFDPVWQTRAPDDEDAEALMLRVLPFTTDATWTWRIPADQSPQQLPEPWAADVGPLHAASAWSFTPGQLSLHLSAQLTSARVTVAETARFQELLREAISALDAGIGLVDPGITALNDAGPEEALRVARAAVQAPTDIEHRLSLVRLLVRLGQVDAARLEASDIAKVAPSDLRAQHARMWTAMLTPALLGQPPQTDLEAAISAAEAVWSLHHEANDAEVLANLLLLPAPDESTETRRAAWERVVALAASTAPSPTLEGAKVRALIGLGRFKDVLLSTGPATTPATVAGRLVARGLTEGVDAMMADRGALPPSDLRALDPALFEMAFGVRRFDLLVPTMRQAKEDAGPDAARMIEAMATMRPWEEIAASGEARATPVRVIAAVMDAAVHGLHETEGMPFSPRLREYSKRSQGASLGPPPPDLTSEKVGAVVDLMAAFTVDDGDDGAGVTRWRTELGNEAFAIYTQGTGAAGVAVTMTSSWPVTATLALDHAERGRKGPAKTWYQWLRRDLKDSPDAATLVRKLLPADPPEGQRLIEALTVAATLGDPTRAAAAWKIAQGASGDDKARISALALVASVRQQNTALAATITASLVARPYLPDEVTILLQNELESKDMCESALPVARAFEASPHKDTNWKRLVQNCLGWLGRTEEAVSYARTLTGDDRSAVANTLAWDLVLLGRPAEAVAELEPVISNGNPSVHKLHTLATALVEAGRPDDAQAIVADALRERRSLTDDWWYVIGRLAQVWGMEDAAQASFERVEHSDDPRSTWALVLKARAAAPPPGAVLTPR